MSDVLTRFYKDHYKGQDCLCTHQPRYVPSRSLEINSLEDIFCWQEDRSLSNNLILQYDKVLYLIEDSIETRKLAGKRVTVFDYYDGSIKIKYGGTELPYRTFDKIRRVDPGAIVTTDRLGNVLAHIKRQQDLRGPVERSKSCPKRRHLQIKAA